MPTKRALIIGINKYTYMEDKYQLKGCVNDAKLINSVLIHKFNFAPENVILLLDEAASLAKIHEAMEHIAQTLQSDDIFVFHFSGHGGDCKVHSEFTDEGTGKDNCILPCDDSEIDENGEYIYREVRDQQFSDWLKRLAQKTQYISLIFDACYSGTMTRSNEVSTNVRCIESRGRQAQLSTLGTRSNLNLQRSASTVATASEPRGAGGWLSRSDNYTVMSASRDTQKAKEWHFDIGGKSVRHGLLSFFLARNLIRAKPLSTYRDIFEQVCAGVVSMVTEQNPQIEGVIDREVFGVTDIEPLDFMPVVKVDNDIITLGGGAAQGVQASAKWQIFPPGTKVAVDDECLALIEIISVDGLYCTAQIIKRFGELVAGARAIEIESAEAVESFKVDISQIPTQYKAKLEAKVKSSKLLKPVKSSKAAQVIANVCESSQQLAELLPNTPPYNGVYPVWVFLEPEDKLAMKPRSVNEPDALEVIYSNLEKMAKFKNVLQLDNRRSKLKVECNLLRLNKDGSSELVNGGSGEFTERELMCIELKNNEPSATEDTPVAQHAGKSVFFAILWLGADRQIMHFYPRNRSCEELAAQKSIRIGSLQSKLAASLPTNHFRGIGSITWKVMFSSKESDFGLLSQEGLRSSIIPSNIDAFDIAFTGEAKPSHTEHEPDQRLAELDWCAINRGFILKRAE